MVEHDGSQEQEENLGCTEDGTSRERISKLVADSHFRNTEGSKLKLGRLQDSLDACHIR